MMTTLQRLWSSYVWLAAKHAWVASWATFCLVVFLVILAVT